MILTSLQKGKAIRLPNSNLKPISRYHLRVVVGAGVGAGAGAGAGVGVFAEATHRHQIEVAALKLVQARPYKPLRNLINRLRSKYVVV